MQVKPMDERGVGREPEVLSRCQSDLLGTKTSVSLYASGESVEANRDG